MCSLLLLFHLGLIRQRHCSFDLWDFVFLGLVKECIVNLRVLFRWLEITYTDVLDCSPLAVVRSFVPSPNSAVQPSFHSLFFSLCVKTRHACPNLCWFVIPAAKPISQLYSSIQYVMGSFSHHYYTTRSCQFSLTVSSYYRLHLSSSLIVILVSLEKWPALLSLSLRLMVSNMVPSLSLQSAWPWLVIGWNFQSPGRLTLVVLRPVRWTICPHITTKQLSCMDFRCPDRAFPWTCFHKCFCTL